MSCSLIHPTGYVYIFFFNDTATTEIYTLSLHDALPISLRSPISGKVTPGCDDTNCNATAGSATPKPRQTRSIAAARLRIDRKSKSLKSSQAHISYAGLFFEKKKKYTNHTYTTPCMTYIP